MATKTETICEKFTLTPLDKSLLKGHTVNGSSLLPATEFLFLVWKAFAKNYHIEPEQCSVILSNCQFLQAMLLSKATEVSVLVAIQKNGNFNVLANNSLVAQGNIQAAPNHQFAKFSKENLSSNATEILAYDDIYKELALRGFDFRFIFCLQLHLKQKIFVFMTFFSVFFLARKIRIFLFYLQF